MVHPTMLVMKMIVQVVVSTVKMNANILVPSGTLLMSRRHLESHRTAIQLFCALSVVAVQLAVLEWQLPVPLYLLA